MPIHHNGDMSAGWNHRDSAHYRGCYQKHITSFFHNSSSALANGFILKPLGYTETNQEIYTKHTTETPVTDPI